MSILLFGQQADRTHENKMLREFIQLLKTDWGHTGKDLILIANSMWGGAEIDLVCILPSSILVVDFKHYSGHLSAAENGPWMIDGVEVKGGSKVNPYQQLRDNKFSIIDWLKSNKLLDGRDIGHINAAVVFTGPITGKPTLSVSASYWFHSVDFAGCAAVLADITSPKLRITSNDIDAIVSALRVQKVASDYGQANRDIPQSSATPERPAVIARPVEQVEPAVAVLKPETLAAIAPSTQQKNTADNAPAQKSRLSGMFKSVAAVGGIFLTMAVVSQIYPTSGQSSPIAVDEPPQQIQKLQPVEPIVQAQQIVQIEARAPVVEREPVFTRVQPEPVIVHVATPVALRNTAVSPSIGQIKTRSALNYVGQEVTACGTVAQYTRFKKGAYLNFDKPYPQQTLTLVIWDDMISSIESKLGRLSGLAGTELCVNGQIEQYNKRVQIQIADGSAVQLKAKSISSYVQPVVSNSNKSADSGFERIEAYRAPFYVGKQVMACGVLAGTSKFAKGMYLSLDKKYPNQTLTLVVWNESVGPIEAKFGSLNNKIGHTFCALGTIEKYKKHLQIQVENPQFLRLMQ